MLVRSVYVHERRACVYLHPGVAGRRAVDIRVGDDEENLSGISMLLTKLRHSSCMVPSREAMRALCAQLE